MPGLLMLLDTNGGEYWTTLFVCLVKRKQRNLLVLKILKSWEGVVVLQFNYRHLYGARRSVITAGNWMGKDVTTFP